MSDNKPTNAAEAMEQFDLAFGMEFKIEPEDIARNVIRYDGVTHIPKILADRTPGQFYAVYPDPKFGGNQALVGHEYNSVWDVDNSDEKTPLGHFWFALTLAIQDTNTYNDWTTIASDEAHKWLKHGKGNEEHDKCGDGARHLISGGWIARYNKVCVATDSPYII